MLQDTKKKLSECIAEVTLEFLTAFDGRSTNDAITSAVQNRFPEVISAESERLIQNAIHRMVNQHMKRATKAGIERVVNGAGGKPIQTALPGLEPPIGLVVGGTEDEGFEYIGFYKATWSDLEAALNIREVNIQAAIAHRDDLRLKMDFLRPVGMHENPSMTIEGALEILGT